jgi:pullulanase-type alpha-1,6-glucosidase
MRHLIDLAEAGLTHIHFLPVADGGVIVEAKRQQLTTPNLTEFGPAAPDQQAAVGKIRHQDGFNWNYETQHFAAPEGAYATDPDGPARIREFREMVKTLHQNGLRVVMDMVYNHTYRAGQTSGSVLDKITPGYYHRLDAAGNIEQQSCCPDTAAEFAMMEKLLIDTTLIWARAYKVDGFRFDLMNFHTRENMIRVKEALQRLTPAQDGVDGSRIYVYGEGWDFGGAKEKGFTYANQSNMAGTGIGTFNDRLRDAVHGGYGDTYRQGFINGLFYDPNGQPYSNQGQGDLRFAMDKIRVGLAGNLQNYRLVDQAGNTITGKELAGTGYTLDPQEAVNYISKHDNETLFDLNVYKVPLGANGSGVTTMADRVRIQNLGLSLVGLAQGIPFFDLGSDMLRSKSLDRDSYDSGDWFNRVDFTYHANNFGVGLPPAWRNNPTVKWPLMKPLLENADLRPTGADILASMANFQEILQIRRSSRLFRLETEADIRARLQFYNTGPNQIDGLIVMSLTDISGTDLDPEYERVVVLFNAADQTQTITLPDLAGHSLTLHPVQLDSHDPIVKTAGFKTDTGQFTVPARTTSVFVERE